MEAEASGFADEIRVLFLRQITVEGIDALVKHRLLQDRIRTTVEFGGYGSMVQDVLAEDGPVATTNPDLIVLALSLEAMDQKYGQPGWQINNVRDQLIELLELLENKTDATIAVHTFIPPVWSEQGLLAGADGVDLGAQVVELNRFILEFVNRKRPRFVLTDWDRYLRVLGADSALDERGRYLWSAPFRRPFLDLWANQLSRVVCALKGRTKKVLVLDCDNTLWGGVVGEDGVDGIELDPNNYPGRAFVDFQKTVLHLAGRGVLITLCSKNNESDVFEVLDHHPACLP